MSAVMICGTASDVGKTRVVAGLCRLLSRNGIAVAPFKAQNMSLNSYVTNDNSEIARSIASQAKAAGCEPEVDMNPILLKPTSKDLSQVILLGKPYAERSASDFVKKTSASTELLGIVKDSYFRLSSSFDVIILEGAGGAAEINLIQNDVVNLPLANELGIPVIVVADIERGGVFASLYGTYRILPEHLQQCLAGFIINKMHGDPSLLESGITWLEKNTNMKCFGILPYIEDIFIDGEDSLSYQKNFAPEEHLPVKHNRYIQDHDFLDCSKENIVDADQVKDLSQSRSPKSKRSDLLDVVVLRFPYLSNYTDFDPLFMEPSVLVRFVASGEKIGTPDLIILPGSKNTVSDFLWMKEKGIDEALYLANARGSLIFGICAGYQMLGMSIEDEFESKYGLVKTLEMLPVVTRFASQKTIRRTRGSSLFLRHCDIEGYEIHHGVIEPAPSSVINPLFAIDNDLSTSPGEKSYFTKEEIRSAVNADCLQEDTVYEGCFNSRQNIFGTSLHGIFEADKFRINFLRYVANQHSKNINTSNISYGYLREYEIDKIADACDKYLDMKSLLRLIDYRK